MNKNTHFLAADVLRGVAIMMVVVYHAVGRNYGYFVPWNGWRKDFSAMPAGSVVPLYTALLGWSGVSLFFVLSGFCIHLSFLRSSAFSASRFFWHRCWRIVPAYFAALLTFTWSSHMPLYKWIGAKQLITHILFIHNLSADTFFGINPSFWSIATEVQLYLLFPVLLLVRRGYGIEGCLVVTFSLGVLSCFVGVATWGIPNHLIDPVLASPLVTWFDWTLGAYVAERLIQSKTGFERRRLWLLFLLPTFILSTLYKPLTVCSFSLAAAVSAVVLDWLVWADPRKTIVSTCLGFVGTISYSIYLWHQPLLHSINAHLVHYLNQPFLCLGVAAFILALSFLSFRIFERGGVLLGSVVFQRIQNNSHVQR